MKFYNAMTTNDTYTENADLQHSTSGKVVLDWFFQLGAMRKKVGVGKNATTVLAPDALQMFTNAFAENPLYAVRTLFYARDIRGGQGERALFKLCLQWLAVNYPDIVLVNLHLIPKYGRWDDLLGLLDTPLTHEVAYFWGDAVRVNKLAAKWLPREKSAQKHYAKLLMAMWGLTPRQYRKLLAGNTDVVETLMAHNEWTAINYAHVPSKAMLKYRKAYPKHDPDGWLAYLGGLEKGTTKVNATTLYPSDIVAKVMQGDNERILDHQWAALPNWVEMGDYIPVCDVSGSMSGEPMQVSIALGLYLSERAIPAFKDLVVTFSSRPQFHQVRGHNIRERVNNLKQAAWSMNTDLRAVFKLILQQAQRNNLLPDEMPKNVLIISDMQFDAAVTGFSTFDDINRMYAGTGYDRPNLIFWNVRAPVNKTTPVKFDTHGVALVSGYSPSIMQYLFKGETPMDVLLSVVNSPRYSVVVVD